VILPDFTLPSRANQRWQFSGLDSIESCVDKQHFLSYPHSIEYLYNSRGYRDAEWPESIEELKNAVWCVGDSFTVGIGQPLNHIWPQVLAKKINKRTINVSMDGASNDWIVRKTQEIVNVIAPKYIVVMWSYTHRRENSNSRLTDEDRRIRHSAESSEQDYNNWLSSVNQLKQQKNCKIIQTVIPNFHNTEPPSTNDLFNLLQTNWNIVKDTSWPDCPTSLIQLENLDNRIRYELEHVHHCYNDFKFLLQKLNNVYVNSKMPVFPIDIFYVSKQLDWARDYHHFDILTAEQLVNQILSQFV
jgi:hypothetical protein